MPIVINEIHITASVDDNNNSGGGNTSQPSANTSASNSKTEIIKECVEEVMRILKEKNER